MHRGNRILTTHIATFGRCVKCIQFAIRSALAAWIFIAALHWLSPGGILEISGLLVAIILSINALAHVAGFSVRRVSAAIRIPNAVVSSHDGWVRVPVGAEQRIKHAPTRREVVWMFVGTAAAAAMATLTLSRSAKAACGDCASTNGSGWYDCITYSCNNVGQACCPPGYPYLNHCDCQCYDGTNFDCSSYSNCNYCG